MGAVEGITVEGILAALDPQQRLVATALDGPVVVLAGAGSGKTRALTHRIAHAVHTGAHDPRRSLALTFTTRAAGELRSRLSALGAGTVQARTFHSAALRQLRHFWPQVHPGAAPSLVDRKAPLVAEAAALHALATDATTVRDLAAEIEWSKSMLLTPERYAAEAGQRGRVAPHGMDAGQVSRVIDTYSDLVSSRGLMDFEDVLLLLLGLLYEEPAIADEVRAAYRHFTVDEYQDVSPVQQALLDAWLGGRHDVCVVGDAAQTIYTFAGATSRYLEDFTDRHPSATVVTLDRCYRCSPQVVALANRLIPRTSRGAHVTLKSQCDDGPLPSLHAFPDEIAEAAAVAARIGALIASGMSPRAIAVLHRVNAQSEVLEDALAQAGIPYTVRGGTRFFERPEVRQAVTLLRGARAAATSADLPLREQVRGALSSMQVPQEAPEGRGAARDRWESVSALLALVDDLVAQSPEATLDDVVRDLERREAVQHAPDADGVTIATFHAAKGMEWDAVFAVGLSEGMVPISYATSPQQVDEEKRLLYVATTRARRMLWLSWAQARTPGQRPHRERSRFLSGLGSGVLEVSGDPAFEE